MIGYASRTGSTENLTLLRRAGWRLLVSASGVLRTEGFPYALDNGAWTDFQKGRPFDEARYLTAVEKLGADADWIVLPDVVADHHASMRMAEAWLPRMEAYRVLVAVQDGAVPDDVRAWLGPRCGIFIGGRPVSRADRERGTHDWKERSARTWGALGKERECTVHMGRVNSARRIAICAEAGVHSFDGTNATKFARRNLAGLDRAVRQLALVR